MSNAKNEFANNPVVAIIGFGNVGKIHEAAYPRLGCDIVIVDPTAAAGALSDIRMIPAKLRPDLWVVATPTRDHLQTMKRIFERDAHARVLCEKPICEPTQIDTALAMIRERPGQIKINSLYRHSEAVAMLARRLGGRTIDSVTIEFAKNRYEDASKGRFVDLTLGALGYEWFHIATILSMLLREADFRSYVEHDQRFSLVECERYVFSSFRERMTTASGISLDLATSVDGIIHHPLPGEIGSTLAADYQSALSARNIVHGSSVRHRFVKVDAAGSEFYLIFHPFDASVPDAKNQHLLLERTAGQLTSEVIGDNHFEAAARHSLSMVASEVIHRHLHIDLEIQNKIGRLASIANSRLDRTRVAASDRPSAQQDHYRDTLSVA
ncbi:Gfo/Idh/MocA family oxidoreductase [Paraburkholderia phenazinium]|uniref:Gfo/Idh/MocA family oxidoreductase n=1 Tax=Paraburkholderia phenazinium TaxID=60549 RepID=UPI00158EC0BA|nr:Gfo/Idh/MocA family oxidoreductase [Paraburkholderia phenazinium]